VQSKLWLRDDVMYRPTLQMPALSTIFVNREDQDSEQSHSFMAQLNVVCGTNLYELFQISE
jgi:hypothetical protein